jgi:heat shock protein HspQ
VKCEVIAIEEFVIADVICKKIIIIEEIIDADWINNAPFYHVIEQTYEKQNTNVVSQQDFIIDDTNTLFSISAMYSELAEKVNDKIAQNKMNDAG